MNILFAASECAPFVKSGGLADVMGSLPPKLKRLGEEVQVMIPKYSEIASSFQHQMQLKTSFTVPVGWRDQYCGIEEMVYDGITYYFLDNRYYFAREGLYGHFDEAERFTFFSRAVLESLPHLDFRPDILHLNDWHTGLVSVFLKLFYKSDLFYKDIKTIFTIHNLKYQGIFPKEVLHDILGLGEEHFHPDSLEFYGQINFLKGGLVFSDFITTVSPTYAQEIQTPYFGEKLDPVLRKRSGDLYGILNGIDYRRYDPMSDPHLFVRYRNSLAKKQQNKLRLQELLGLEAGEKIPMVGMVTRLVEQKGLDLIIHVLDEILALDLQFVILGTGDVYYEQVFRDAARRYPDKCSVNIRFDEPLSRQIYASCDLFLMPSRFEPCGIGQMIAMRYAALPLVRETGGLKDTVHPYNERTGEGNGFSFTHYNAHDMLYTLKHALAFYEDEKVWRQIMKQAKQCDFSWGRSAARYQEIYREVFNREVYDMKESIEQS